jgi:hypothetical protein
MQITGAIFMYYYKFVKVIYDKITFKNIIFMYYYKFVKVYKNTMIVCVLVDPIRRPLFSDCMTACSADCT